MLCNKLSPPYTFPNKRNVRETGLKRMDSTSMKPTAMNKIPSRPKIKKLTCVLSALLPNQSLIIAFNPVFLGQLTSNLIDGFLYAIVVILVISYLNIKKKSNYRIEFILAIIILINIKFTGLVFAFLICAYIMVNEYLIAKSRTIKIKEFIFLTILIIPFLYSPYIQNNYSKGKLSKIDKHRENSTEYNN